MSAPSRIVVCQGPRAAERRLLDSIEAALAPGGVPDAPLLVVVPSTALKHHLQGRLLGRRRAWLGLEVRTLAGVTQSILANAGIELHVARPLESLLAARFAAREPALYSTLGGLAGGFEEVAGAVSDLLDAGFVDEHLEALLERLDSERPQAGRAPVDRAQALGRVATSVRRELAALGLVAEAERTSAAARTLAADPDRSLPVGFLFVHGFADATGVATDLLEALVRHRRTLVVLDSPLDLDRQPRAWRFGARLRERLTGIATLELETWAPPPARCAALRAADPFREARTATAWLQTHDSETPVELAAVVTRHLTPDVGRLAVACDRGALAASAEAGLATPWRRRIAALIELLETRSNCPLGVVFALATRRIETASGRSAAELRLAFAQRGIRTLGSALSHASAREITSLPLASRFEPRPEAGPPRTLHRQIAADEIGRAHDLLRRIAQALPPQSARMPLGERGRRLSLLLAELFESDELDQQQPGLGERGLLGDLRWGPAGAVEVDDTEWLSLLGSSLPVAAVEPVGAGGGVALLSATEARGRTFERLVLAGLTEGGFPRPIRSDPLLADALRLRLRDLLPDLPVKSEGHDEERYLFAQLIDSAPVVALLHAESDELGRPLAPSSFLQVLERAGQIVEAADPHPLEPPSALDFAIAGALAQRGASLEIDLAGAIREGRERFDSSPGPPPESVAAARRDVLRERDGGASPTSRHLGPFLGIPGSPAGLALSDLAPSVTALESFAGCGWRTFLERILRLRALPDLAEGLPTLPASIAGSVVHSVLESLLPENGDRARPLADVVERSQAVLSVWPPAPELEARTHATARRLLHQELLDPDLFATALTRTALSLLEIARAIDWPAGERELLAVEATAEAQITANGRQRRLPFRVDRVETDSGEIVLTDYKTGRPLSEAVTPVARRRHLGTAIAAGSALQLPVYLLSLPKVAARARYLYLRPDLDERCRELALSSTELAESGVAQAFEALCTAWDAGVFVPRLLDPKLNDTWKECAWCDVREACVQGDSAARLRLERWARQEPSGTDADTVAHLWWALAGGRGGERAT